MSIRNWPAVSREGCSKVLMILVVNRKRATRLPFEIGLKQTVTSLNLSGGMNESKPTNPVYLKSPSLLTIVFDLINKVTGPGLKIRIVLQVSAPIVTESNRSVLGVTII